ncbi:MAG: hypothetical protein LC721_07740 [Actinobacteria bacterium]|nr:hypothetical protein [Actinomycetota bacterium]
MWVRDVPGDVGAARGKSRRFTEPVTLVAALEGDDAEVRAGMVQRHRECLDELTGAADHVIAVTRREDPAGRGRGWRC